MSDGWKRPVSRRQLLAGAASAGLGAAVAACDLGGAPTSRSIGGKKELRILQRTHFVPSYDAWIDGFVHDFGEKHGIRTTIDHIPIADLPARMAVEIAVRGGHDLIEMCDLILTDLYETQLVEMGDIIDYAQKKYGPVEPVGKQLAYVNGRWVGFPNYYTAIQPQIRTDLFQKYGFDPAQVKTWQDYLHVGTAAKSDGHAAGLAISHCNDANHNWRAVMWAFGASEVKADGHTINVDTPEMRDFLNFAQTFYSKANTPEVFAWDDYSDNRWLASGSGVFIHDAVSSMRSIQSQDTNLYAKLNLRPPVAGPAAPLGVAMPQSNVYIIWKFSRNQDTAKEFLRDYIDSWLASFQASQVYNMPMYGKLYDQPLFTDPAFAGKWAERQYGVLQSSRGSLLHTSGYPGPPNYAANQVLGNFVIPDMVATAVRQPGPGGIQAAIDFAKAKLKFYYI